MSDFETVPVGTLEKLRKENAALAEKLAESDHAITQLLERKGKVQNERDAFIKTVEGHGLTE